MSSKTALYRWVVSMRIWAVVLAAGAFARTVIFGLRRISGRLQQPRFKRVPLGPERFRSTARDRINLTPDGWDVHTNHPGHTFIAWEMAIRYEAASREARLLYEQLCDMPTSKEADELIEQIAALLAKAEFLSRIERTIRPVLNADADDIRVLAWHPHAAPRPSQVPRRARLKPLARKHLENVLPKLRQVLEMQQQQQQGKSFYPEVFSLILEADSQIPGPGTHIATWNGKWCDRFPFDKDYEAVLRPLRYIPAELWNGYEYPLHSRYVVITAGAHLEGCIKTALRDTGTRRGKLRKPLGALVAGGFLKDLLDPPDIDDIQQIARIAVNPAKHDFINDHGPESLFSYEDALYAYFLARHFGASILKAAGSLPRIRAADKTAIENDSYFR